MKQSSGVKLIYLLALIGSVVVASVPPSVEDSVFVLTNENFDSFLASREYVLVEFYASWCGHCKKLTPQYAAAAQALESNPSIALGKVEATEQSEIAGRFDIAGYPTIKLFSRLQKNPIDYNGGRTTEEIVAWLQKRTGPASHLINSTEELTAFNENNTVTLIYFGTSTDEASLEIFNTVAASTVEVSFAHVLSQDIIRHESTTTGSIVMYKNFDERKNVYSGKVTAEGLTAFIKQYSTPLVMPFNDNAIQIVFQKSQPTLFIFSNDNEASIAAEAAFYMAAKENKGKVIFSITKPDDGFEHYPRLADYLGVNVAQAPVLILIHATNDVVKYQFPQSTITVETITKFVNDYSQGKLKSFLKSDEIPETNDEPVKVIVGKSFDHLVYNTTADVLVEFYAPWCGHCQELASIYEVVAKRMLSNPNIIIAKVDSTTNEIPNVAIQGFPTIKFFQNGKKNSPIDFEGERTEEGILSYLQRKTTHPWVELKATADSEAIEDTSASATKVDL